MGVAVSSWWLARAVAETGQLGVISDTGLDAHRRTTSIARTPCRPRPLSISPVPSVPLPAGMGWAIGYNPRRAACCGNDAVE
jgi:hypothetical protein